MKKWHAVFVVTSVLFLCVSVSLPAEGSWSIVSTATCSPDVYISGFHTEKNGFYVGFDGVAFVTAESGRTWKRGANSSLCLWGLEVLDKETAFSCGNGGIVRRTTNAGLSWQPLASFGDMEPLHPKFISFADSMNGWCATRDSLGSTTDGGKTWKALMVPLGAGMIYAMYLRTPLEGYVMNTSGQIAYTTDGGITWTRSRLDWQGNSPLYISRYYSNSVIHFDSPEKGYIIAYCSTGKTEGWKMFSTENACASWVISDVPGKSGSLFLSRDGAYLTITDLVTSQSTLLIRQ